MSARPLARGDGPPDAEVLAGLYPRLIGYAVMLTRNVTDAEDIVQTALVRYWQRSRLATVRDPFAYLRTVITREHIRHSKAAARTPRPVSDRDRTLAEPQRVIDDRALAADALSCLSRQEQAALVARFYLDLSETETAAALGCSVGAVKRYVSRARAKLAACRSKPPHELAHSDE